MELTAGKCCTVLTQSHQAPTLKHHSLSGIDVCSYWPQKIKKCASAYEPVTRKSPIQQSESNLWGEAHFRYSVVLANGLSELHPSSFELRLTEKYSRYFENIFPICIRVSFHKSKHCRTDALLFSSQLWSLHMCGVRLCSVKKFSGALLMPTITNADQIAKRLDYKTLTGWSRWQVLLIVHFQFQAGDVLHLVSLNHVHWIDVKIIIWITLKFCFKETSKQSMFHLGHRSRHYSLACSPTAMRKYVSAFGFIIRQLSVQYCMWFLWQREQADGSSIQQV